MKNKDYLDVETTQLLLEKLEKTKSFIDYHKYLVIKDFIYPYNKKLTVPKGAIIDYQYKPEGEQCMVPAYHMYDVQTWLREQHNISIEPYATASGWKWDICKTDGTHILEVSEIEHDSTMNEWSFSYHSYEEALNIAIREALKCL